MTTTTVVMIILGLIIIIASFFMTEKLTEKEESYNLDLMTVDEEYEFSEREQRIIKRKIEDAIAEHAKDILYDTNESLSAMANEKTMALGDYAVAVCDEIEKKHKEVMFLYSMLEDKQKEIMKTVQAVDRASAEVKQLLREINEQAVTKPSVKKKQAGTKQPEKKNQEGRQTTAIEEEKKRSAIDQLTALRQRKEQWEENAVKEAEETEPVLREGKGTAKRKQAESKKRNAAVRDAELEDDIDKVFEKVGQAESDFDAAFEQEFLDGENSNDIILEMYRNGDNVIHIAKQLGLGVGEVKLVIDLYQGEQA